MDETLFIDGAWRSAERTFAVRDPYRGDVVGHAAAGTPGDVQNATRSLHARPSTLAAHERARILQQVAGELRRQVGEFAEAITRESGMCLQDTLREVKRAANLFEACAEEAKRIDGTAVRTDLTADSSSSLAISMRQPVGVVLAITPFNRPLNQVAMKLGPALAANNRVLLKPSEKTPLTAVKLLRLLHECGLPRHLVGLVTGSGEELSQALTSDPHIDMLTFTGSAQVGRKLARDVGMIRTLFELGDNGALLVLRDADLKRAIAAAVKGAFASSGQSCRGVKRLIVEEAVASEFAEGLARATEELRIGDPLEPETEVGTLIDEAAAESVERRVTEALHAGARLLCGAKRRGAQYWPTVLDHVDRRLPLVAQETFGPCAPIVRVKHLEDALEAVNAGEFGLQTGVFTGNLSHAFQAARELNVGTVVINAGPQFESLNVPFGGVKASGLGREGVRYAVAEMTILKTLVMSDAAL